MRLRRLLPAPILLVLLVTAVGAARAALPPRYDFALRVASEGTISTLDPCRARTWPERDLVAQLFEGLVARANRGFRPALASDWTVSADSLTWTFHMDARRTFGDGTPVRAADVVASWQRAGREAPEWAWLFDGWGATVIDPLTVRATLRRPLTDFLERLALPAAAVVRETLSGGNRSLSGAGPFRFAGRDADGFILAPRLDDPRGRPFPGRIFVRVIESAAEIKALWKSGGAAIADAAAFEGKAVDGVGKSRGTPTAWLLLVNPARPALAAPAVRAALEKAIDRGALVGGLAGEGVTALARFEQLWGPGGTADRNPPAASGGAAGTTVATLVVDQSDRVAVSLGEDLVRPLSGAGLSGAPKPMAPAAWRQALKTGDYDLLILRWEAPAARAALALPELLFRPELARLAPAGLTPTADPGARLRQLTDAHLLVPLVRRNDAVIGRSDLVGLSLDPLTGALRLADVWPTVRDQP